MRRIFGKSEKFRHPKRHYYDRERRLTLLENKGLLFLTMLFLKRLKNHYISRLRTNTLRVIVRVNLMTWNLGVTADHIGRPFFRIPIESSPTFQIFSS
jgi:hypothetical protein